MFKHFVALGGMLVLMIGFVFNSAYSDVYRNPKGTYPYEEYKPQPTGNVDPGKYYRDDDKNEDHFGSELLSSSLCEGAYDAFNHDFDITRTEENARNVFGSTAMVWERTQDWEFGDDPDTPWGGDDFWVLHEAERRYKGSALTDRNTQSPWTGREIHWRDGNLVRQRTEVYAWVNASVLPGWDALDAEGTWLCPKYYKIGGWADDDFYYNCDTKKINWPAYWVEHKDSAGGFKNPTSHNGGYAREGVKNGVGTGVFYDCVRAAD